MNIYINIALVALLAAGLVYVIARDARDTRVPRSIYLLSIVLFITGTILAMTYSQTVLGGWLILYGALHWGLGRKYQDDVWRNMFPGLIFVGLIIIIFKPLSEG